MDTKFKKFKGILGTLAFLAGLVLLLVGGSRGVSYLAQYLNGVSWITDAFQTDYQRTAAFRNQMTLYLENMLTIGAGGPLSRGGEAVTYDAFINEGEVTYGSATSERVIITQDIEGHGEPIPATEAVSPPTPLTPEECKAQWDAFHRNHKEDLNLLYSVSRDEKVLYTNYPDLALAAANGSLPKGYSFILAFDGSEATITKDGKVWDIYGDGYYRAEEDDWYLPGYENFKVDEKLAAVEVTLVAIQEPMFYLKTNYSGFGSNSSESNRELYWIASSMAKNRNAVLKTAACLGGGLLSLAIYFALRKDKQQADKALARLTGRLPFEIKVLAIPGLAWLLLQISQGYWGYLQLATLMGTGAAVLFLLCLAVNDLRYNKKVWRNSLWALLLRSMTAQELKLPLQKRLMRRSVAVLLLATLLAALAGLGLLSLLQFSFYGGWARCLKVFLQASAIVLLLFAPILCLLYKNQRLIPDLGTLTDQISAVHSGDYSAPATLPVNSDLRAAAEQLSDIERGMEAAIAARTKSERMKVELITNVSHDIKTPLTAIISYIELLNRQENLPPEAQDYIHILDQKAQRLKSMVLDVFEVSKAAAGQLPVKRGELDFGKLLRQTLADMEERIAERTVTLITALPDALVFICADGDRLYRVFQNLLQNALQYSLPGSRVYLSLRVAEGIATATLKNTSQTALSGSTDFTARFVRGDESRTDGGSGLGLSIAESFTVACGGTFQVETDADLFTATVAFPVQAPPAEVPAPTPPPQSLGSL